MVVNVVKACVFGRGKLNEKKNYDNPEESARVMLVSSHVKVGLVVLNNNNI